MRALGSCGHRSTGEGGDHLLSRAVSVPLGGVKGEVLAHLPGFLNILLTVVPSPRAELPWVPQSLPGGGHPGRHRPQPGFEGREMAREATEDRDRDPLVVGVRRQVPVVGHDELEPGGPMLKGVSSGWPLILSSLKTLLESGQPLAGTSTRMTEPPQ